MYYVQKNLLHPHTPPPLTCPDNWVPRVRYVVFDEIHSIADAETGWRKGCLYYLVLFNMVYFFLFRLTIRNSINLFFLSMCFM